MTPEELQSILLETGLSRTKSRLQILSALQNSEAPLSGKEILKRLDGSCDRSTIYRTLNTLYENKVIQRVISDHEMKYAVGTNDHDHLGHQQDHIHFKCKSCGQLICLADQKVADYALPEGFTKEENQFLIIGTCQLCQ